MIYLDDLRVTEVVTVFEPTGPPLGEGLDRFVCLGIGPSQQVDYEYYWNQLTPGNAGKWGSVEGTRDQMNWDELDTYYELAQTSDLPFRFHVLVWGNQQPGWIAALPPDEQLAGAILTLPDDEKQGRVRMRLPPSAENEKDVEEFGFSWVLLAEGEEKQEVMKNSLLKPGKGRQNAPGQRRAHERLERGHTDWGADRYERREYTGGGCTGR